MRHISDHQYVPIYTYDYNTATLTTCDFGGKTRQENMINDVQHAEGCEVHRMHIKHTHQKQ